MLVGKWSVHVCAFLPQVTKAVALVQSFVSLELLYAGTLFVFAGRYLKNPSLRAFLSWAVVQYAIWQFWFRFAGGSFVLTSTALLEVTLCQLILAGVIVAALIASTGGAGGADSEEEMPSGIAAGFSPLATNMDHPLVPVSGGEELAEDRIWSFSLPEERCG